MVVLEALQDIGAAQKELADLLRVATARKRASMEVDRVADGVSWKSRVHVAAAVAGRESRVAEPRRHRHPEARCRSIAPPSLPPRTPGRVPDSVAHRTGRRTARARRRCGSAQRGCLQMPFC